MEVRMEFEEYLKAMRQRAGITQKELAGKSKISTSYLNLIETGKKKPNPTVIRRLSRSLDGDVDQWLDLAGYEVPELPEKKGGKEESDGSGATITIIGEVGSGESPYFGTRGPQEEFDVDVVRVLDNTFRAFGYQQGDLLIVEKRSPKLGELVITRVGGGKLAIKMYEKSMYEERMLGSVTGLIRRFERRTESRPSAPKPGPGEPAGEENTEELLSEIKTMLGRIASGNDDEGASR